MRYELNIKPDIAWEDLGSGIYSVIIYQLIRQYSSPTNKMKFQDLRISMAQYWHSDETDIIAKSKSLSLLRTIKRNLQTLMSFDPNIEAEYKDGSSFCLENGDFGKIDSIWYEQELSYTDLQLLSTAVIYSKHLSDEERKDLLQKLSRCAGEPDSMHSKLFESVLTDAGCISLPTSNNLFHNLEYIFDAIQNCQCLSFTCCQKGPHGETLLKKTYKKVSPYKIVLDHGIYYLIAYCPTSFSHNHDIDEKDAVSLEKIKIHKIQQLSIDLAHPDDYKPVRETVGSQKNLLDFINSRVFPWSNTIDFSSLRLKKHKLTIYANARGLDVLIDSFGNRMKIESLKNASKNHHDSNDRYSYRVILRNPSWGDWAELYRLLMEYPTSYLNLDTMAPLIKERDRLDRRIKEANSMNWPVHK